MVTYGLAFKWENLGGGGGGQKMKKKNNIITGNMHFDT